MNWICPTCSGPWMYALIFDHAEPCATRNAVDGLHEYDTTALGRGRFTRECRPVETRLLVDVFEAFEDTLGVTVYVTPGDYSARRTYAHPNGTEYTL